jgi:hypothetical protein
MQTHLESRHSLGTQAAIFALAVATACWCVALLLNLLAYLRWESVMWAAMSRGTMFCATVLASAVAFHLFARRPFWRKRASSPSLLPNLRSAAIVVMVGVAWFLLIVPASTTLPTLALPALIGTLMGFEAHDQNVG